MGDMGQSVLTPEEDLLGKVGEPVVSAAGALTRQWGKGNSGQDSETGSWGTSCRFTAAGEEALKQLTTVGRQGSVACGELSFLFDVADALTILPKAPPEITKHTVVPSACCLQRVGACSRGFLYGLVRTNNRIRNTR